jgi:hypothetical protein
MINKKIIKNKNIGYNDNSSSQAAQLELQVHGRVYQEHHVEPRQVRCHNAGLPITV